MNWYFDTASNLVIAIGPDEIPYTNAEYENKHRGGHVKLQVYLGSSFLRSISGIVECISEITATIRSEKDKN